MIEKMEMIKKIKNEEKIKQLHEMKYVKYPKRLKKETIAERINKLRDLSNNGLSHFHNLWNKNYTNRMRECLNKTNYTFLDLNYINKEGKKLCKKRSKIEENINNANEEIPKLEKAYKIMILLCKCKLNKDIVKFCIKPYIQ